MQNQNQNAGMQLDHEDKLPLESRELLHSHVRILGEVLREKLIGVYVHGSIAMGCFNFAQSDVDYLAVVSTPLSPEERQSLSRAFLAIFGEKVPANGVEMSIVEERYAGRGFRYPTPYEFHMGTKEQIEFHGRPHGEMADPDLAAHFMITKRRGICIYGRPIDEVFAEVPARDYLASIAADSAESFRNIDEKTGTDECMVPRYAVLNFCRVLAYIREDLVTSKAEGGEWGMHVLPAEFRPIISAALAEYRSPGSSEKVDPQLLRRFATFSWEEIRRAI